jgi:dihydropteroate synthase
MKYRAEFFDSDGRMVCMTYGEARTLLEAQLHEQASCVRHRAVALRVHDVAGDKTLHVSSSAQSPIE